MFRRGQLFNDGLMRIYTTDDNGNAKTLKYELRFEEKVVGAKRYFAARSENEDITRLVSVPYRQDIGGLDIVVIDGIEFEIVQVQPVKHDNPPATKISLKHRR